MSASLLIGRVSKHRSRSYTFERIFREHRVRSEALWKQEQVYLYVGKHSEVDHLYVIDKNEENRYAIGYLCHDLYLGLDTTEGPEANFFSL